LADKLNKRMSELKNNKTFKLISLAICFCFLFEQTGFAQTALELNLAAAFSNRLSNTFSQPQDKFRPLHLRYLDYDALSNNFKLLLDRGDSKNLRTEELQNTTKLLMEYFYIGLRLPNSSFWVNLRPDSADKTIDPYLAQTDLGKVLLEADVQLKKDTASYTSSQTPTGKEYWNKLYQKAEQLFGNQEVTIPTLTRPWIVPAEIILRESQSDAYIYKATLKVMLEEDYLKDSATYNFKDPRLKALNQYSSQLIRELIIPKLNKEVNSSKKYSNLRQAYYSLILAQWFKSRFKGGSLQGTIPTLIDSYDLTSLTSKTPWSKDTYFKQYQKSFKDGEYNIKEQVSTPYGQAIRSYVSGGIELADIDNIPRAPDSKGEITTSKDKRFKVIRGIKGALLAVAISTLFSASVFGQSNEVVINELNDKAAKVEQVDYRIKQGSWENFTQETYNALKEVEEGLASEFLKSKEKVRLGSFAPFKTPIKDVNFYRGYIEFQQKKSLSTLDNKDEWHYYGERAKGFFYRFSVINEKGEQLYQKSPSSYDFAKQRSRKDMWFDIQSLKEVIVSGFFKGYFYGLTNIMRSDALVQLMDTGLVANKTFIDNAKSNNPQPKVSFDSTSGMLQVYSEGALVDTVTIKRDPYFGEIKSLFMKLGIIYDKSGSNKEFTAEQERQLFRLTQDLKGMGIAIDWITGVTSEDPSVEPFNESIISENLSTASGATFMLKAIVKTLNKMSENKDSVPKVLFVTTKDLEEDPSKDGWAPVPVDDLRGDFDALLDNLEKNNGYIFVIIGDTVGHYGDKSNLIQLIDEYIRQCKGVQRIFYQQSKIQNMAEAAKEIMWGTAFSPQEILLPEKIKTSQMALTLHYKNGQSSSQDISGHKQFNQVSDTILTEYSFSGFLKYGDNRLKGLPKLGPNQTATIRVEFDQQEMALETDTTQEKFILYDASGSRLDGLNEQTEILKRIGRLPGFSRLGIFSEELVVMNREELMNIDNISDVINIQDFTINRLTSAGALKQMLELAKKSGKPTTIYLIGDLVFTLGADTIPTDLVEDCLKQGVRIILLVPTRDYSSLKEEVLSRNHSKYIELITDFRSGRIVQREGDKYREHSKYTIGLAAVLNSQYKGRFLYSMRDLKNALDIIRNSSGQTVIKKFVLATAYVDIYDAEGKIIKKTSYKIEVDAGENPNKRQEFENSGETTSDLGNTYDNPQSFALSLGGTDIATVQQEIESLSSVTPENKQAALEILKDMQEKSLKEIVLTEGEDRLFVDDTQGNEIGQIILPADKKGNVNTLALINLLLWAVFKKRNRNKNEEVSDQDEFQGQNTATSDKGGIDFRALPIITQPITNIMKSAQNLSTEKFASVNLDKEIDDLQGMVRVGIIPSTERIKDYIRASSIKGDPERDIEKVTSCILEILKMEESSYLATDPALEDILAVFDSQLTPQDLRSVFFGIPLLV